jgi:hypothetical protein
MSPLSTLNSCGSSSMRSLRITAPTRVTRLSLAVAQTGLAVLLGVGPHAAELVDEEGLAVLADTLLPVQQRARGFPA